MTEWTGRALAEDLAAQLRSDQWMVWTEMPLGSVLFESPQRADVLAIRKSYTNPVVKIFEIKVSVNDFRGDVARQKYTGYFSSANYVLFAVPQGLIKACDLPQNGVGLIVRGDKGWHVVKAGRHQDFTITTNMLLALLMKGYEDHCRDYRSPQRRAAGALTYTTLSQAFKDYGVKLAQDLAANKKLITVAEDLRKEISEAMGRDFTTFGDGASYLRIEVAKLIRQTRNPNLALEISELARDLFDGNQYANPVYRLEQILTKAREVYKTEKESLDDPES